MSLYNHKISLKAILKEIPDIELSRLSREINVDYCTKVLTGKLMFYLLLYGMLRIDRLSQRGLADAFSSPMFKLIYDTGGKKTVSHSSISERLSVIDLDFFKLSYDIIFRRLSSLYTADEIEKMLLQRVDSTLVAEAGNKLLEGMTCGNEYKKKRMIKYTMNFDGMFASFSQVHSGEAYANESLALPENVLGHFKKEKHHSCVYILDRGQASADKFSEFKKQKGLHFVGRLAENRKLELVEEIDSANKGFKYGTLIQDQKVRIYGANKMVNSKGNRIKKQILLDDHFRVIRFMPSTGDKEILLITNIFDLPAETIAEIYKRRWDIEVFFRFLKQELNFSHFLSLNENGIQVIMYMTLITAMLVMIYKKENQIGYKTAVRRIGIELEALVIAVAVIQSGGDITKVDLPDP
ncbi:MAG: IS4 family transposase [Tenuifilaceae bacterium]|jgi:hypothetical protein|nr:IS4 family transposase [Tenuifilaceae bacterium]